MANDSQSEGKSPLERITFHMISLFVVGLAAVITNTTFLVLLYKIKKRKSFFFLQGFAWCSLINGLADVGGFLRRIAVILMEVNEMTRRECITQALNVILFFVSETGGTVSMFSLCLDRFASMYRPIHPHSLQTLRNKRIGAALILSSALFTFILAVTFGTQNPDEPLPPSCYGNDIMGRSFYEIHYMFNSIVGISTVLLYLITLAIIRKKTKNSVSAVGDIQLRRQVVVTKRLSVVLFSTFFLQVVPFMLLNASTWSEFRWKSMVSITVLPRGVAMAVYPIALMLAQPELNNQAKALLGRCARKETTDQTNNSLAATAQTTKESTENRFIN
uniref:G-protein coupled receptors family 1 profile domain-containing protein n=1 Tax=Trichuris muris TaxID=70415 RepID=A0A5S6QC47_TRIMR